MGCQEDGAFTEQVKDKKSVSYSSDTSENVEPIIDFAEIIVDLDQLDALPHSDQKIATRRALDQELDI